MAYSYQEEDFSSNYAIFSEIYPEISRGRAGEYCNLNSKGNMCLTGLKCVKDPFSSATTCEVSQHPTEVDMRTPVQRSQCVRTTQENRCHKTLSNGSSVFCPESHCSKERPTSKPVPAYKCQDGEMYHHRPSQNMACIFIDKTTGVPEIVPENCCQPTMLWAQDLEEQYSKFALSPQFYGTFR